MSELPPYYQEKVRANIDVDSLDSARETVLELTERPQRCANLRRRRAVEHRQADGHDKPGRQADHQTQQQTDGGAVRHGHRVGGAELLIMSSAFPITVIPRKRRGSNWCW